jgi:hypothetical protein
VWQLLCGAHDSPVKKQYADYIKATSACEKVIRRDIARTNPEHDFFKEKDGLGQESLFNVMKAYSLHDREVGYCQGSGFIVGLLLMQVNQECLAHKHEICVPGVRYHAYTSADKVMNNMQRVVDSAFVVTVQCWLHIEAQHLICMTTFSYRLTVPYFVKIGLVT